MSHSHLTRPVRIHSIRPLVRYVDNDRAIVQAHVQLLPHLPGSFDETLAKQTWDSSTVDLQIEVNGFDGFRDIEVMALSPQRLHAIAQIEIIRPELWWPAGMGEQALYRFSATLLVNGVSAQTRTTLLGLTSVRTPRFDAAAPDDANPLFVNGRPCPIESVLPIDCRDERRLLPVRSQSLLHVRDHYGSDMLYDAADRAGILLLQSIPIHVFGTPETGLDEEVSRLAAHPSLAGWFVGNLGAISQDIAKRVRQLDPTHQVFLHVPRPAAA
jgi:hypothetical protein